MAPEQARGKPVDKRADIWAFGVVLFEMLTGDRPFHGEDLAETLASVMKDKPDLSSVHIQVPRLVERCLKKDLRKRLRDIGDVSIAIDDALTAPLVEGATAQAALPTERRHTELLQRTAVAALVIAAGIGLWKLSARLATPPLRVLRFAVSIPASQGFSIWKVGKGPSICRCAHTGQLCVNGGQYQGASRPAIKAGSGFGCRRKRIPKVAGELIRGQ